MEQHDIKSGDPRFDDEEFYANYYNTTLDLCETQNIDLNNTNFELEIYITSFDGLFYAKYQIRMLRKFLSDIDFNIVFCDTNGNLNGTASADLMQLCIDENVSYIKLPHNKMQDINQLSYKLGTDLNWIWRNSIKHREPKYFAMLDHDCFLISHIWEYMKSFLDEKGMYGYAYPGDKHEGDTTYWLIHIMNTFFRYDFVKDIDLDFRPAGNIGLDTNGCNYYKLFNKYKREDYLQDEIFLNDVIEHEWEHIFRDFRLNHNKQWLHALNGNKIFSGHPNERICKETYLSGLLNGIILYK